MHRFFSVHKCTLRRMSDEASCGLEAAEEPHE
jgi:hypothetical protein